MSAISKRDLLDQLHWRYATKRFDPARKIPAELWSALEEALILSPSSFGLQPWKFVVVTDPALKTKLRTVSWDQPQIEECSHLVVFAMKRGLGAPEVKHFVDRIAEVRGVPVEALKEYRDMMLGSVDGPLKAIVDVWSSRQVYIALGTLLASAAMLGVDACPMEGIDPAQYDEILGLKDKGFQALCVCALGYRAESDAYSKLPKVRFTREEVVEHR